MREPLVSVIIANYNGKKYLEKCLSSVLETLYSNFEVIFVDNGSTDGSLEILREFQSDSRMRIVENGVNMGYAMGNNVGIVFARGDYVVFLNNDTIVEPDWLTELVNVMESDVSIGAAQSKLLLMDSPTQLDSAGNFLDFSGTTYERGKYEEDVGKYEVGEIFACKGASMIVRHQVLDRLGVFDPDYFFYYEETDLCWRFRLAGYRIVFAPSSIVYHKSGGSIPTDGHQMFSFHVYLLNRNRIATLLKNYEIQNIMRYLVPWLISETRRIASMGLSSLRKRSNIYYSMQSSKAILWNLKHFRHTWKKRIYVQNSVRRVTDAQIMSKMQIR